MYKDVIGIIEEYSHIDLKNYKYKCDNCNTSCDEISCCIYSQSTTFNSTYSSECEIYRQECDFKFQYICKTCKNNINCDIFFYFKYMLEFESFEKACRQTVQASRSI